MAEVRLHPLHQLFIVMQACCGNCSVDGLAVIAVIQVGNIRCNQLAFSGRQRVWLMQEDFHQIIQRFRCFRTERHGSADPWQIFRQMNIGHGYDSFQERLGSAASADARFAGVNHRRSRPPLSTTATPTNAGNGLCSNTSSAMTPLPVRKTTGAAGYHQRSTGLFSRKSEAADNAKKHTAEKMTYARIRSKAPKQSASIAMAVWSRTALAGVPKRGWILPNTGKKAP